MKKILILLFSIISSITFAQNVTILGTVENTSADTLTLTYDPLLLGIKPQTKQHFFSNEKTFKFDLDIDPVIYTLGYSYRF